MDGLGDRMKTSIVILTHNHLEVTKLCIESIRQYTNPQSYELIVVDNASTDGTTQWLSEQQDIRSIFNTQNMGFPAGCNQGMKIAIGDNIMLLNNDVVVTKGWLENLLTCLYSQDNIGAVGPITNRCAYYQTIPVSYQTLEEMQPFAAKHNASNSDLWEERLKLIGYAFLFKRVVYEKVGELDEIFSPGNFEDDDYSIRIRQAGYKLILCKDTFIHHFGSVSFNEKPKEYQSLLKRNEEKFVEKWGFDSQKTMLIRYEILPLITHDKEDSFSLLEIGSGCGGTLLQAKNSFPKSKVYGFDSHEAAARQASSFADVRTGDWESFHSQYTGELFEYIVINNVLEKVADPIAFIEKAKSLLHPRGSLIMINKNLNHIHVIEGLAKGVSPFAYDEKRYFTLNELTEMLGIAGFSQVEYSSHPIWLYKSTVEFMESIIPHANEQMKNYYRAYEFVLKATANSAFPSISISIEELQRGENVDFQLQALRDVGCDRVIEKVMTEANDRIATLNLLAVKNFEHGYLEDVIPYLQKAYELDEHNLDTLYNLSAVMEISGETELAAWYAEQISKVSSEDMETLPEPFDRQQLKFLVRRIEFGVQTEEAVLELLNGLKQAVVSVEEIINVVTDDVVNKVEVLNLIGVHCYENDLHEEVIPLLQSAYDINRLDHHTLYNLAYVMNAYGEKQLALSFVQQIEQPDETVLELMAAIKGA
ncbi:glycosyltransferase [Brevibacillus brevis]|uniref:Glycosyltransferase n=1 Tax=Brevibacillus brevis TaxID=1393 RepID=A0A2Z4MQ92_BREBE|nr:glycosyltransferase [Brevibacillus brevis]AWX58583.1 glycosyltransferase [Brevibacillus brevis]